MWLRAASTFSSLCQFVSVRTYISCCTSYFVVCWPVPVEITATWPLGMDGLLAKCFTTCAFLFFFLKNRRGILFFFFFPAALLFFLRAVLYKIVFFMYCIQCTCNAIVKFCVWEINSERAMSRPSHIQRFCSLEIMIRLGRICAVNFRQSNEFSGECGKSNNPHYFERRLII